MVALVDRGVVEEDGERLRPVLLPQLLEEVADVLPLVAPADEELVVDDSLPGGGPHHLGDVLASAGSGLELRSHRAQGVDALVHEDDVMSLRLLGGDTRLEVLNRLLLLPALGRVGSEVSLGTFHMYSPTTSLEL